MSKLQFEEIKEPQPKELDEALKLRIWNKLHKEYFYVEYDKDYDQIVLTNTSKTIFYPLTSPLFTSMWGNFEKPTGLCDKNGTLTYEGDICVIHFSHEKNMTGIVKYMAPQGASFEIRNIYNNSERIGYQLTNSSAETMEVIGNIYKNPELLGV